MFPDISTSLTPFDQCKSAEFFDFYWEKNDETETLCNLSIGWSKFHRDFTNLANDDQSHIMQVIVTHVRIFYFIISGHTMILLMQQLLLHHILWFKKVVISSRCLVSFSIESLGEYICDLGPRTQVMHNLADLFHMINV